MTAIPSSGHNEPAAPLPRRFPKVSGRCPACGSSSLFVASGDHVTCGYIPCPDPCLVADFLLGVKGPDLHVAEFDSMGWHIEHTMRCRLDGMSDCLIHKALCREPDTGRRGRFHVDIVSGVLHYQEAPDGR